MSGMLLTIERPGIGYVAVHHVQLRGQWKVTELISFSMGDFNTVQQSQAIVKLFTQWSERQR